MTTTSIGCEWPQFSAIPPIVVPTAYGPVFAQLAIPDGEEMLVITSRQRVVIPLVRFHSSCTFGEGIGATDCDCGVQLEAAVAAIVQDGGIITYAWEEGRGVGIADKLRALALQQSQGVTTAEAFIALGHVPEPRTFANHVTALRQVFDGSSVRLASANPAKVKALEEAGIAVAERLTLNVPLTPERRDYVAGKVKALGHHQ